MGHLPNWQEADVVGVDREYKDMTDMYDDGHGCYEESDAGKPKRDTGALPLTPDPFAIKPTGK